MPTSISVYIGENYSGLVQILKHKTQNFCKSLAWCTKYSQKINRIIQIDCKSRDESNSQFRLSSSQLRLSSSQFTLNSWARQARSLGPNSCIMKELACDLPASPCWTLGSSHGPAGSLRSNHIHMSSNVRGILFNASLNRLRNLRKYIVVLLQGVLKIYIFF